MTNLDLWNKLGKTDPNETKAFTRGGGFRGTAIKPMWVWKQLTDHFGPMGTGWGCSSVDFKTVEVNGEVLVYCTVICWHGVGALQHQIIGVGGDKVAGKNKNGISSDDEAFKKAYTDALMNAFKFIGVAADIHMGMFDDNKYVQKVKNHYDAIRANEPEEDMVFTDREPSKNASQAKKDGLWDEVSSSFRGIKTLKGLDKALVYYMPIMPNDQWRSDLQDMYDDNLQRIAEAAGAQVND